ncbi:hypothetical protein ADUPG1_010982, partial [Aduncisulcus paluster]
MDRHSIDIHSYEKDIKTDHRGMSGDSFNFFHTHHKPLKEIQLCYFDRQYGPRIEFADKWIDKERVYCINKHNTDSFKSQYDNSMKYATLALSGELERQLEQMMAMEQPKTDQIVTRKRSSSWKRARRAYSVSAHQSQKYPVAENTKSGSLAASISMVLPDSSSFNPASPFVDPRHRETQLEVGKGIIGRKRGMSMFGSSSSLLHHSQQAEGKSPSQFEESTPNSNSMSSEIEIKELYFNVSNKTSDIPNITENPTKSTDSSSSFAVSDKSMPSLLLVAQFTVSLSPKEMKKRKREAHQRRKRGTAKRSPSTRCSATPTVSRRPRSMSVTASPSSLTPNIDITALQDVKDDMFVLDSKNPARKETSKAVDNDWDQHEEDDHASSIPSFQPCCSCAGCVCPKESMCLCCGDEFDDIHHTLFSQPTTTFSLSILLSSPSVHDLSILARSLSPYLVSCATLLSMCLQRGVCMCVCRRMLYATGLEGVRETAESVCGCGLGGMLRGIVGTRLNEEKSLKKRLLSLKDKSKVNAGGIGNAGHKQYLHSIHDLNFLSLTPIKPFSMLLLSDLSFWLGVGWRESIGQCSYGGHFAVMNTTGKKRRRKKRKKEKVRRKEEEDCVGEEQCSHILDLSSALQGDDVSALTVDERDEIKRKEQERELFALLSSIEDVSPAVSGLYSNIASVSNIFGWGGEDVVGVRTYSADEFAIYSSPYSVSMTIIRRWMAEEKERWKRIQSGETGINSGLFGEEENDEHIHNVSRTLIDSIQYCDVTKSTLVSEKYPERKSEESADPTEGKDIKDDLSVPREVESGFVCQQQTETPTRTQPSQSDIIHSGFVSPIVSPFGAEYSLISQADLTTPVIGIPSDGCVDVYHKQFGANPLLSLLEAATKKTHSCSLNGEDDVDEFASRERDRSSSSSSSSMSSTSITSELSPICEEDV